MSELSELERIRLEKLQKMREQGLDPFPHRFERTHQTQDAIQALGADEGEDQEIRATVAGRIRSMRHMGKISFAHIEDGQGMLQLFFRQDELGEPGFQLLLDRFDLGDFIGAEGVMFRTRSGEVTLRVESFRMLAKALSPLPAAKEERVGDERIVHSAFSDPEGRYRQRYADLAVNPEVREIFRTRARVIRSLQ
ncbi:MAG: lysine--tRNA ligase, partial [Anaerolineales bacterium]